MLVVVLQFAQHEIRESGADPERKPKNVGGACNSHRFLSETP